MKKLISIIIATVMFFTSAAFAAAEEQSNTKLYGNHADVTFYSANGGSEATIVVTGPNMTYSEYSELNNIFLAEYLDQKSIVDGKAEFSFPITGEDGIYRVTVLEDGILAYSEDIELGAQDSMNALTTTRTAPWMLNYHLTTAEQYANGYAGGECGQMVWGISISPVNSNLVLMGTDTAGIYKSEDGGTNWRQAGLGFNAHGVTDITFHPDMENVAFAAAAAHGSFRTGTEGIWKSEDAGETWKQVLHCGFKRTVPMNNIAFADGKIYVGAYDALSATDGSGVSANGGVYVSEDLGENWENIGLADETVNSVEVFGGKLYAATNSGVYALNDNGGFECVKEGKTLSVAAIDNTLYCIDSSKLYKSTDGGQNWITANTNSGMGFGSSSIAKLTVFGNALGVSAHPYSGNFRFTTDGGNTFNEPVYSTENVFLKGNKGYYAEGADGLADGTIIISVDGEIYKGKLNGSELTLNPSASGISGMRAENFLFDAENPDSVLISTVDRGLLTTVGETETHSYLTVEQMSTLRYNGAMSVYGAARDPRNNDRIIMSVGTWNSAVIAESTDGGKTFAQISGSEGGQCEVLAFNGDNPDIIYAGDRISYDNGATWTAVENNMKIAAVSPFDGNKIYALKGQSEIYLSEDAGKNWSLFCGGLNGVQRIHADLAEEDKLWAGTFMSGLLMITPSGASYKNNGIIGNDGGVRGIFDISQDPKNPKHMVAGGADNYRCMPSAGLFESFDGGETWTLVEGLTGTRDVWTVEFHPTLPRVYIGTSSGTFVYEFERFTNEKRIITERDNNGFKIWNFTEDKLNMNVFTAVYSADNVLKSVNADCVNVYRNRQLEYRTSASGEIVKQFIWNDNLEPIAECAQ